MLDRLDEAFRAESRLIDDASPELSSPLAMIRAGPDAVLTAEESDERERLDAARIVDHPLRPPWPSWRTCRRTPAPTTA
jgi:hypothetical protein